MHDEFQKEILRWPNLA